MLGLPDEVRGCLFDMDGVLTRTALIHAAAWKEMFDEYLRDRAAATGTPFVPFDATGDYERYVDGRKRLDGTREFLLSRGIDLPEGRPDDPPGMPTVNGLSNRKNELVQAILDRQGVEVFEGSVRYLRAVRDAGLRRAVVSSSANTRRVLAAAGIDDMFDARIDGEVAKERGLAGKPAPDMFLAAAEALGLTPAECAVFEDALAGVAAGRAGGFALVVGVDRGDQAQALRDNGADIVVSDLSELLDEK
ncbi:beta-phosphoglucomutase family hydrolase [Microbispora hainanensis]|jgi:beta-phosphoglucomutase family hydrolase|uniref:Beta-phosphoglucomutase n=1 Tax=Microbispora hainanensis TaxID=568844 RepID=A0ABZ1SP79_9ACTN|nr:MULTISPECIES: beta-phosphoglucomutase family hydrolase [Microbispora]NJP30202.1 beta-phosphoglucomutase family hydrolase [Microbispora sp. CL1-1]TQS02564.1 beta-phosphoglucomutase family hydrolase [Microbispora sp. SCL1-1]